MSEHKRRLMNIRRMFIPDPGHFLLDADLAGADAFVFAWQLGSGKFKEYLSTGVKFHVESNRYMFSNLCGEDGKAEPYYTEVKSACFGSNYGGGAPTLAANLGWTEIQARRFQEWHFRRFPEIKPFHRRVEMQLQKTREVHNPFGYRIHYFGDIRQLLPEALAWVPQSTVAIVTVRAARRVRKRFPSTIVRIILQVHDSLVFQIPYKERAVLPELRDILNSVEVPFPEPLKIPWSFKASSRSWGHVRPLNFDSLEIAA